MKWNEFVSLSRHRGPNLLIAVYVLSVILLFSSLVFFLVCFASFPVRLSLVHANHSVEKPRRHRCQRYWVPASLANRRNEPGGLSSSEGSRSHSIVVVQCCVGPAGRLWHERTVGLRVCALRLPVHANRDWMGLFLRHGAKQGLLFPQQHYGLEVRAPLSHQLHRSCIAMHGTDGILTTTRAIETSTDWYITEPRTKNVVPHDLIQETSRIRARRNARILFTQMFKSVLWRLSSSNGATATDHEKIYL